MNGATTPRGARSRDTELSERLRLPADAPRARRWTASLLAHSADGWWCLVVAAAFVVLGGRHGRASAATIVVGFLSSAAVVRIIKASVRRERPPGEWGARQRRRDPHAFPSGHSARATMLAIVLGSALGSVGIGAALGVWALAVATARVALGVHYLSDVVVGILIGAACGLLTTTMLAPVG